MTLRNSLILSLVVFVGAGAALAGKKPKQDPDTLRDPSELTIWHDPQFQQGVTGSYQFNSEIEPSLPTDAREILVKKFVPLMEENKVDEAIAVLEGLVDPDSTPVYDFTLGNLYYQKGEAEKAAPHYENAIAKFGNFRRALKNLGMIRVRQGEFDDAIKSLSRVVELGGSDGTVYGLLGYSHLSTEHYLSAESAYREAMLLQPNTLDWKLGLTQAVLKQRKYAEAVVLLDELIADYPERSDFLLMQANAFIGLEEPMRAAENFEIVQRMGKATPTALHTLGDIYVNEELADLAARAYALALEEDPAQPMSRPLRNVEVMTQRGRLDEARSLLSQLKETYADGLDPEERKKVLKLEARIAVAEGEGGDAVGVLEEIVSIDPLDGEALMLLGQHYADLDDADQAIFYYERAEGIEAFEADAKVRHAQLLVTLAKYAEAVPLLKRAQELKPREDVGRYLEDVERIARTRR